jgi:hypothetical protein
LIGSDWIKTSYMTTMMTMATIPSLFGGRGE